MRPAAAGRVTARRCEDKHLRLLRAPWHRAERASLELAVRAAGGFGEKQKVAGKRIMLWGCDDGIAGGEGAEVA